MADTTVVTDVGMAITTNRVKGSGTEPCYGGWGTGTTAAAAANTGLETPAAESRVSGTSSQQTKNTTNDTYRVVDTITCSGSGKAITEHALFDASTSGNCYVRATFSAMNVSVGDSIQFTTDVTYDQ